eukprot:36896-Rhodomonas_salina.1
MSPSKETACWKMACMVVTDEVSQREIFALKADAPRNISRIVVTDEMFQPEISPLKATLERNKSSMSVMRLVSAFTNRSQSSPGELGIPAELITSRQLSRRVNNALLLATGTPEVGRTASGFRRRRRNTVKSRLRWQGVHHVLPLLSRETISTSRIDENSCRRHARMHPRNMSTCWKTAASRLVPVCSSL